MRTNRYSTSKHQLEGRSITCSFFLGFFCWSSSLGWGGGLSWGSGGGLGWSSDLSWGGFGWGSSDLCGSSLGCILLFFSDLNLGGSLGWCSWGFRWSNWCWSRSSNGSLRNLLGSLFLGELRKEFLVFLGGFLGVLVSVLNISSVELSSSKTSLSDESLDLGGLVESLVFSLDFTFNNVLTNIILL